MFDNLTNKLEKAFKVLKGQGSISEINVAQTMKEIRKTKINYNRRWFKVTVK